MVMNFWEAQKKAKVRTALFITVFILLTLIVAAVAEFALRYFAKENYNPPYPYFGLIFLAITFLTAGFQYFSYSLYGGRYIAEAAGGEEVYHDTRDLKEIQLKNIVEEIAIASGVPVPEIFVIECRQINAFAAGLKKDKAAIAVTRGALMQLNRDELQGVIAHEFGHLHNGDMLVSTRLAAMVMGFFIVFYIGLRLLEGSFFARGSSDDQKGGGGQVIALAGLIFIVAGLITWFAGSILKSFISREREYLADACAVQYTRNPSGIGGALKKIAKAEVRDMPKSGIAYSHLYFDDRSLWNMLFATHPPIEKRIAAIEGGIYTEELTEGK